MILTLYVVDMPDTYVEISDIFEHSANYQKLLPVCMNACADDNFIMLLNETCHFSGYLSVVTLMLESHNRICDDTQYGMYIHACPYKLL